MNHTVCESLSNQTPDSVYTGQTTDISVLLCFNWWQPVYHKSVQPESPLQSNERRARFMDFGEHVGHAMAFKLLWEDTQQIIYRSKVRPTYVPETQNLCIDPSNGENMKDMKNPALKLYHDFGTESFTGITIFALIELVREQHDEKNDPISYNNTYWKFKEIVNLQTPLDKTGSECNDSKWNILFEWEDGSWTCENLVITTTEDDPVTCTVYENQKGLLRDFGWKRFRNLLRNRRS